MVLHIHASRTPGDDTPYTEEELDDAFAWSTESVLEQEAWPADRLAELMAGLDVEDRVRGVGGIARVLYDARAARHLLKSRRQVEGCLDGAPEVPPDEEAARRTETIDIDACGARTLGPYRVAPGGTLHAEVDGDVALSMPSVPSGSCSETACDADGPAFVEIVARPRTATPSAVTVSWDPRTPPYVPCLDGGFPPGSAIVKADYRRVGFGVLLSVHDTSASALEALLAGDADWGEGRELADPGPEDVFTVELPNGNRFRLAALHVMTKELDHWTWVTLWWSADPAVDFGADRPESLERAPWSSYKMCAATEFAERDPSPTGDVTDRSLADALGAVYEGVGGPTWCSNPFLERGVGNAATNCVGCHQYAGTELSVEEILALDARGRPLARSDFPTDYAFTAGELMIGLPDP
jgi:hypothetical protein